MNVTSQVLQNVIVKLGFEYISRSELPLHNLHVAPLPAPVLPGTRHHPTTLQLEQT